MGITEILLVASLAALFALWRHLLKITGRFDREKKQTQEILNSLTDGVLEYDADSRVNVMNSAAEWILGVKEEEVAGRIITPDIAKNNPRLRAITGVMYPALAQYASSTKNLPGGGKSMEIHLAEKDLKLLITLTPVKNEKGAVVGFLKIIRDISRERLFERLRSEFVSIAAHQLRTPLSAIKWSLELLLDGDVGEMSEAQRKLLSRGYDTNERMIRLVGDLLNAARIEEGRFGYDFAKTEMEAFLRTVIKNASLVADIKNIKLKLESGDSEKIPPLLIDPEKLGLALSNLIGNAIKYTPPGGLVTVSLRKKGAFVEVSVKDTGVGIPLNEQKRVFTKFFRASNAIRTETEGTGLGLFIVKNIIRRHGGEIKFESEQNKGSTFSLTLPIEEKYVPKEETVALEDFLDTI